METTLSALYALQTVDSELEEIADMKGDLPGVVAALEEQVGSLTARLQQLQEQMRNLKAQRDTADGEIVSSSEKIEKFKSQQLEVKSNKQYDALAKEIDTATSTISSMTKEMESFEGKMKNAKADADDIKSRLGELNIELTERRAELAEVNKEHEVEESKLNEQRMKIVAQLSKSEMERYERIRKAKGGKAIVPIKRGSCGGCFNRIPPQKILELHQTNRFYMCENCGRIIVSDAIVTRSSTLL